ncbi:peflin or Penta-EF hand domain-containing protein 1 [Saccharomyces pastorianus]|uniref:Peflin or Penta-EF hand domain-containing protein 1 n=1 Tax=Saccharomyces pastorianus TaxID=27292 RepID=A0A6C1E6Z7_SACPS|nr:peflin or Penta-EF hand domain-containing protein 1 [Saccharomyces pastorianus]
MCAKKLKYAAGDDFVRYATPKEAMEETRREFDKERQRQQQMKAAPPPPPPPSNTRIHSAPIPLQNQYLKNRVESGHQSYGSPQNYSLRHTKVPIDPRYNNTVQKPASRPIPPQPKHYNSAASSSLRIASPASVHNPQVPASTAPFDSKEDLRDMQVAVQLFHNHDIKGKNRLTAEELQNLLQNDDNSHFCISSVDALINLFGASRFGTVNQAEFISLYKRVKSWRKIYVDNDINGSLTISVSEFHNSLQELGYLIPFEVSEKTFDQYAEFINRSGTGKELKFDKFVEALVWLMRLTKLFRKFDTNQEGIATIQYKDFIDSTLYLGRFLPH